MKNLETPGKTGRVGRHVRSCTSSICDNTVFCRVCTFLTDLRVHLDDKMRTKIRKLNKTYLEVEV